MASINDYIDLVPVANSDKPNFLAVLAAALTPFVDGQNALNEMPTDFDIDVAIGAQLDVVGQWVGFSRRVSVPIEGVYFSFDIAGVGLDDGVWLGPGDPIDGLTSLDDATYRLMLKIKVRANHWDGSLEQAQDIFSGIVSSGALLFVVDNFDMSMTIGVAGVVPSALFIALLQQSLPWLRPETVELDLIIVTSVSGTPIFGFDIENDFISGLDVGAWGIPY